MPTATCAGLLFMLSFLVNEARMQLEGMEWVFAYTSAQALTLR